MIRDAIQKKGIDLGMSERNAYLLAIKTDRAKEAANDIRVLVQSLLAVFNETTPDDILSALRMLDRHVGYSNSIGTAWAELANAAGAVTALLETV